MEIGANVAVQNEKSFGIALSYLVTEVVDSARCTQ
jgi:hypothetical protein